MSRGRMPGLTKRGAVWHIEKQIKGYGRLRESCGTTNLNEAERYLTHRLEEIRLAEVYGVRPTRTFEQAAVKYLEDYQYKRSIERDVIALRMVMPYIGQLPLDRVHNDALAKFRQDRRRAGRMAGTINKELAAVRRILNLAARVWRHPNGQTWLPAPPLLEMERGPARRPYPISWEEQGRFFRELPAHLERIALFAVNTGCRSGEICRFSWDWEVAVPEVDDSVFLIPDSVAKNGQERIVVLNRIARKVVESERGKHPSIVFTYHGEQLTRVRNHAWKKARDRAGLPEVRVHDLRHTFGHRLRAAGVSFEDRQDLLGHKSTRMTTHYSSPDLIRLLDAANLLCEKRPATVLRVAVGRNDKKSPQNPHKSAPQKDSGRPGNEVKS
jgi:integrase